MSLYRIRMPDGKIVNMLAVHITETNLGLSGEPSRATNKWELEVAQSEATKLWTDVPVLVILPQSEISEEDQHLLPKFRLMALLEGQVSTKLGVAFSYLSIIFFQETPYPFLSSDNEARILALDWERLADQRGTEL